MDQLKAMEIFVEVARQRSFTRGRAAPGPDARHGQQDHHAAGRTPACAPAAPLHARSEPDGRGPRLSGAVHGHRQPGAGSGAHGGARGAGGSGAELAGPLRIQAPSSFGSAWLADAVARFSLLHPQVQAELFVDDALLDPIRHGFDLTIRVGGIPDSSALAMRPLAPCRAVLCASPAYLAQWGVPQTPQELLQHQCLHFSHLTDGTNWHFQRGEGAARRRERARAGGLHGE